MKSRIVVLLGIFVVFAMLLTLVPNVMASPDISGAGDSKNDPRAVVDNKADPFTTRQSELKQQALEVFGGEFISAAPGKEEAQ